MLSTNGVMAGMRSCQISTENQSGPVTIDLPLSIGHAADKTAKTGVTVILPDDRVRASCHVAGGGPGTRETDLLAPENSVEAVDAIVLSGGSVFGLAAADSIARWLLAERRGLDVGGVCVPIVPAAVLFDLANGGDKSPILDPDSNHASPYAALGRSACEAAKHQTREGSVGAGIGATLADVKGGFGSATSRLGNGAIVSAFVAVNAVGSATFGGTHFLRAAALEQGGEFGGHGLPSVLPEGSDIPVTKLASRLGGNTTIAVIATDLPLSKAQLKRLAIAAHDGIALAVYPAHLPLDGDTVFSLTTDVSGDSAEFADLVEASALAASTLARAIARGVVRAEPADGDRVRSWRELLP